MRLNAISNYTDSLGKVTSRGTSVRAWALKNKIPLGSVYNALRGLRNGPEAQRIRRKLAAFIQ
jgi:hypothetical protein